MRRKVADLAELAVAADTQWAVARDARVPEAFAIAAASGRQLPANEKPQHPWLKSTKAALQTAYRLLFAMATLGLTAVVLLLLLSGSVGSGSEDFDFEAASAPAPKCPLKYERMTYEEVKQGATPYLFGGRQRPNCVNCDKDHLWSNFCQFKSHGQLCTPRDSEWLVTTYVKRNWTQLLTLTPCDFWPFLEGRTLWIMGDSQSLDLYKALKCFLYEFWDLDHEEAPVANDPELSAILSEYLTPSCVAMPGRTRLCYVRVDPADYMLQHILPAFPRFGSSRDLLVANFGLHHGDRDVYQERLQEFAHYVEANRRKLPAIYWQQTTPQHFTGFHGEYPGGKPPFECHAIPGLELQPDGTLTTDREEDAVLLQGGWRNQMAAEELQQVGVTIVPSYNETVPLYYYHRDNGKGWECTHFCFPSAQQTWVFALYRAFVERSTGHRLDPTARFLDGVQLTSHLIGLGASNQTE